MAREPGPSDHRSVPAAYRKDLARNPGRLPFGSRDDAWLAVATLLHRSATLPLPDSAGRLTEAMRYAREIVGEERLIRGCHLDAPDRDRFATDAIRILSEDMEDAGALTLSRLVIDAALAAADPGARERGVLLAHRARLTWKAGELDAASSIYETIERMGADTGDAELRIRAWVGFAALAQLRGNYPEVVRWCKRIVADARAEGMDRLVAAGEHGLMAAAAVARDFESAVAHAWNEYELSAGDAVSEADVLQNVSTLLLDMGDADAACAGYAAVLARTPPARLVLYALGGFARASAARGDLAAVRWAGGEVLAAADAGEHLYQTALALMECARALATLGHPDLAAPMRERALRVASEHGYHELAFRADAIDTAPEPPPVRGTAPLPPRVREISNRVKDLRPATLPRHVLTTA